MRGRGGDDTGGHGVEEHIGDGADEHRVEHAARLPLRWGTYRERLGWGLLLIVGGTVALAGADTFQLLILLVGTAACVTGWSILPADGWRRLVVALPATLGGWLLLGGPRFVAVLTLPYLCWLLVRHRPASAWLTALVPIVVGVLLAQIVTEYQGMLAVLAIEGAALFAAGAGAAALSRVRGASRSRRSPGSAA